jgi:hypothetical protein
MRDRWKTLDSVVGDFMHLHDSRSDEKINLGGIFLLARILAR